MTDIRLQDHTNGLALASKGEPPDIHRISVRFEAHDLLIEVTADRTVEHILTIVATDHALLIEDLYIVREGEDAPLACEQPIHDGHQRRHHVHHRQPVTVTVNYQAASHHRRFRRHGTLEAVLDWAIRVFDIDASMAGEFELTRTRPRRCCDQLRIKQPALGRERRHLVHDDVQRRLRARGYG